MEEGGHIGNFHDIPRTPPVELTEKVGAQLAQITGKAFFEDSTDEKNEMLNYVSEWKL